jgi:hypothetical protein
MAALRDPYILLAPLIVAGPDVTFGDYIAGRSYTVEQEGEGAFAQHCGCTLRYVGNDLCFDRQTGTIGYALYNGKNIPFVFEHP